ncbi:MAG: tetratricopeptide (TPR) repeat protein, partial [Pseudohongiellaceae bacterium]
RARTLDPDVVGALHGLGEVAYMVANHPSLNVTNPDLGLALAQFRAELEVHPDHGESHRDAGLIFYSWSHWRPAMEHLLEAERCGIQDSRVLASIAHMSVDRDKVEGLAPVRVGGALIPVYEPTRALGYAEAALALNSADPNVLYFVADVMLVNDRWDTAIELLQELMTIQPWRSKELQGRVEAFRQNQRNKQVVPAVSEEAEEELEQQPEEEPASFSEIELSTQGDETH